MLVKLSQDLDSSFLVVVVVVVVVSDIVAIAVAVDVLLLETRMWISSSSK
jgi:hypothetical protein